jgi:hypothetical protein
MEKKKIVKDKKRIVKDYDKLPKETQAQVKMEYPNGFAHKLISYIGLKNEKVSALPFETEETYYLIRMTVHEARQIIKDDDDYNEDGRLRDDFTLDDLDIDGLVKEGEADPVDDDEDDFVIKRTSRRHQEEDDDDDY